MLYEMKFLDSRLVEKNLHHIFRWYKRRGEWYETDKERAMYVMRMMANLLDELRGVEHDSSDTVEACQKVLMEHHLEAPSSISPLGRSARLDEERKRRMEGIPRVLLEEESRHLWLSTP